MTIAQKRATSPKLENKFLSGLQKQLPELIPPAIALFIFLAIWQVFSWTPGATLPGPIKVIQDTWILILYPFYDKGGTDKGLFWQIWASLQRVAISYTLAAIVGIGLGVLIGVNQTMAKALDPLFQLLRTVYPTKPEAEKRAIVRDHLAMVGLGDAMEKKPMQKSWKFRL